MARNGPRKGSRRTERDEAPRAADRTDRVLGLDELARGESVRATGGPPAALVRELGRRSRPMVAELEPIPRESMALRGPGDRVHSDAHRPRWVDLDYLPRVRPHRFKVPPFERGTRVSGRPGEAGFHTMIQESLTFS